jgi:16S rRNA (guanine527-N7)-methyltransferase
MDFREKLKSKFAEYNITLNDTQILQFEQYYNLLIEWNNKFNLTAITDEDEVIEKHFLDSVLPKTLFNENAKVIDIGAGAGFPSIPLKIMRPDLSFILIDSVNKKVTFINEVISKLKLNNTTAIHTRIEELAVNPAYRECFDVCVSRAVARLNTLVEYSLPFVKLGGDMLAYKSKQIDEEIKEAKKAISILGGTIKELAVNNFDDNDRNVVVINKISTTPAKYPRPKNLPRTKPLV